MKRASKEHQKCIKSASKVRHIFLAIVLQLVFLRHKSFIFSKFSVISDCEQLFFASIKDGLCSQTGMFNVYIMKV